VEQLNTALRSLTRRVCRELEALEVSKRPIWTVVNQPDATPHVVMDDGRPALSDLGFSISIRLLRRPEYEVVAEVAENSPELRESIIIDGGGFLREPEPTNLTRALVMNFLWRYLREGAQLDWDETRFVKTFNELEAELRRKSVVSHTTMPLSKLKMDIDSLDFGDELKLLPASIEELERWLNPDRSLPTMGTGPPQWDSQYVDRPAVLHARRTVVGRIPSTGMQEGLAQMPPVNVDQVITALRLVMNAPISVIFREQRNEGLMAFGGRGTSWGLSPPALVPVAILDQDKATHVRNVWQLLRASPNIDLLRLPLRQWESSLMRLSLEDKLIDAWISLEALLLGSKEGELSYRAALLLSELLGTSGTQRKAIFDTTRVSYSWRSAIVHALSTKRLAKRATLQDSVQLTTENLHSALLKVLEMPSRFNPDKLQSDLIGRN